MCAGHLTGNDAAMRRDEGFPSRSFLLYWRANVVSGFGTYVTLGPGDQVGGVRTAGRDVVEQGVDALAPLSGDVAGVQALPGAGEQHLGVVVPAPRQHLDGHEDTHAGALVR
jgi:hypothetical protein